MDIRIKTEQEFHDDYVTIEIRANPTELDPARLGELAGLKDHVADLETASQALSDSYAQSLNQIQELELKVAELTAQRDGFDQDREAAWNRANEIHLEWAHAIAMERRLREEASQAQKELNTVRNKRNHLATKLANIENILSRSDVQGAVLASGESVLSKAFEDIRTILTSQA